MSNRVASLLVRTLLAAAPIACHPQQASNPPTEAHAEAPKAVAGSSSTGSSSTVGGATVATDTSATSTAPTTSSATTSAADPSVDAAVPRVARVVRTATVGKWPEEVAALGDDAFVATSGSRIVRRVDLVTGTVEQSIRAGTFPVNIVTGTDEIWTVDYNSRRTLFEIDASGKATSRGKLPDQLEKLAFADGILFALLGVLHVLALE